MRYILLVLLLAGCADQGVKDEDLAAKRAKEEADRKRCDYMVGGPRDSEMYLKCIQYD